MESWQILATHTAGMVSELLLGFIREAARLGASSVLMQQASRGWKTAFNDLVVFSEISCWSWQLLARSGRERAGPRSTGFLRLAVE